MVLNTAARTHNKPHLIISTVEHDSVLLCARNLLKQVTTQSHPPPCFKPVLQVTAHSTVTSPPVLFVALVVLVYAGNVILHSFLKRFNRLLYYWVPETFF